ncbi:DUF6371 domain-containing protein [Marinilabilia rubra]|uniref:Toprim domain-containing protein n=1 Tax=Marinilabilia rubra TaxID=2162893 RepID=A0A2U2B8I9_9BACT|nr:DUF6371 domain-containing protein [Marinilabilia rubra]PWD99354.1 hypothetical protein DDZ16_10100 [Marinilabilia rubra]
MSDIRYSLEKYKGRSTRYHCPQCHQRTFTRYLDNHSKKHLSDYAGRCNRVEKCGYHFTPKLYFEKNGYESDDFHKPAPKTKIIIKPPSCIDKKLMQASLTSYHQNNFAIGLSKYFPERMVVEVLRKYYVGTAKGNKTIFWQVNRSGQVRTGKVMQYNSATLKRVGYINWVHYITKQKDFNLKQVFFGAHLLIDKTRPVAVAEGEKNAIFGALYYPQYNWIAVGSIEMLNVKKLNALRDYQVTLFPDKGKAFDKWRKIAENTCFNVHVNTVLENTNLNEGDDIADLVISIKKEQYLAGPEAIIDKLKRKNKHLNLLIEKFDLCVTQCPELDSS